MKRLITENINGILGTLLFHLVIIAIMMGSKLSSYERRDEISILVDFERDVTAEEFLELTRQIQAEAAGNLSLQQSEARNIAVSARNAERPIPDQFTEMSQEELSELESRVNQILNNAMSGENYLPEQPEIKFEPIEPIIDPNIDLTSEPYSGPTTITYDLGERHHLRIPVPVYKCPDGGLVTVNISVNREGQVIRAVIDGNPSNFNESCIFDMALEASLSSRFNSDVNSPQIETGTITFYFQKQ